MRSFRCQSCAQLVVFENSVCLRCGSQLAFDWPTRELVVPGPEQTRCVDFKLTTCNWLAAAPGERCVSCALTRTRPNDDDGAGLARWAEAEAAKRRVLFELAELGLPVHDRREADDGMVFELLSARDAPVTTGHADGVVTLDLTESDDAERVARRERMGEPYRTLLGHFRHELGHLFFDVLVLPHDDLVGRARELFGDEREDYQEAMDRHYEQGAPEDWAQAHVSAYATMHPFEDWAETWAHLLHIWDTVQTAWSYEVEVLGRRIADPRDADDVQALLDDWLPLSYALNAATRSLGHDDAYPFVLPGPVTEKLGFILDCVRG